MTRIQTSLAALVAVFLFGITAVQALQCGPRGVIEGWLQKTHGEEQVFVAINQAGDQLSLYHNPESGSWSVLLRPRKTPELLCPLDSGLQGRLIWTLGPQVAAPAHF